MAENPAALYIELSALGADNAELDELTHQLISELEDLQVDSIQPVSKASAADGTKGAGMVEIAQMIVTLAPVFIPPLFGVLKSWVERKPSTPVKVRVRVGKRTAQIEYDPTKTSAKDLETLVKTLGKAATG